MGAMRSWLAIGEVQTLLNPCTGSDERGVSPGSPGQWTVVDIAPRGRGQCEAIPGEKHANGVVEPERRELLHRFRIIRLC